MIDSVFVTTRKDWEDSVKEMLQQWIEDFGDSGYSTSYTSREDDRIQVYIPWGDAELVRNDGDEIQEHAYAFCADLAPEHVIDEEKVNAFIDKYIK